MNIQQNNDNLQVINLIKNRTIRSRLTYEYNSFINNNYNVILFNHNITNEINKLKIEFIVSENQLENQVSYKFIIDFDFPFKTPTIFYNNKPYSSFLKLPIRFNKIYNKLTGESCMCCSSLNCRDNWSPIIKLYDIINDIKKYRRLKRMIYIKILCNSIIDKYLINDINIFSYLY
jgi:ubiquitin-protein ligase